MDDAKAIMKHFDETLPIVARFCHSLIVLDSRADPVVVAVCDPVIGPGLG